MESIQKTPEPPKPDPLKSLSDKHRKFVEAYCQYGNGAKAYRDAGYSDKNAANEAYKLLRKPEIRAALDSLMEENAASAGECIGRMSIWSRGNLEPFLNPLGEIDIRSEAAQANIGLLKKYKHRKTVVTGEQFSTETTTVEVELFDAKDATIQLLNLYGRYKQPLDPKDPTTRVLIELGDGATLCLNG